MDQHITTPITEEVTKKLHSGCDISGRHLRTDDGNMYTSQGQSM